MEEIRIELTSDLTERLAFRESLDFSTGSGRQLERILAAYRFPRDAPISCGISSCRTPHCSGYLVETSDGLETNIGNVCGAKHMGADFHQERNRFRAWERRKRNRATIAEFQEQAEAHRQRLEAAMERAKVFWRFKKALSDGIARALGNMGKTGQERLRSKDRLLREDAKALHEGRSMTKKFAQWYSEERPTVSDLGLHFPGTTAMVYPFHDTLVVKLQKPLQELMAMGKADIDQQTDRQLDDLRQQIQAAPRRMQEAEEALDKADALMAVAPALFRFLPDVYPANYDD